MTPGDPLDPLELALLIEVAEDLADLKRWFHNAGRGAG
jgi:hypothetical protein